MPRGPQSPAGWPSVLSSRGSSRHTPCADLNQPHKPAQPPSRTERKRRPDGWLPDASWQIRQPTASARHTACAGYVWGSSRHPPCADLNQPHKPAQPPSRTERKRRPDGWLPDASWQTRQPTASARHTACAGYVWGLLKKRSLAAAGVKRMANMRDRWRATVGPEHSDHIEANRALQQPVLPEISTSQAYQLLLLPRRHGFQRMSGHHRLPCLDLDEHQRAAFHADQVDLASGNPHAAADYPQPLPLQIAFGQPFAVFPESPSPGNRRPNRTCS